MIERKKAILYIRVSTDEQNNGYSPADQKARLIRYCEQNNIEIVAIYHEDESAKTFNRPEWKKIIAYLKKNRGSVDLMLFIKWDRFSRNIAEAYGAIKELNRFGVEPQAIEQPLNFEIPEQKLMLAIYLAAPEVDNDRRALNIFHGTRRGKKEGRWLGGCLRGYKNARDERNKPVMIPEGGLQQKLVEEAFKRFSTGLYQIEDLRRQLNREGLKASRNSFWMLLRNKGYIGKVFVPKYKDEPAEWVQGQHEPIIEESVFYAVQDILDGRRKKVPAKNSTMRNEFPLRGFLGCPRCGKTLTASASKGRNNVFLYYHCTCGCGERKKVNLVHEKFLEKIKTEVKLNDASKELFKATLHQILHVNSKQDKKELAAVTKQISKIEAGLKNARKMLMENDITPADFKAMKVEAEEQLEALRVKENQLRATNEDFTNEIDYSTRLFSNLDEYYDTADVEVKHKLLGSMFPEKLVFDETGFRTAQYSEVVNLLRRNNGLPKRGKKEKPAFLGGPSCEVVV